MDKRYQSLLYTGKVCRTQCEKEKTYKRGLGDTAVGHHHGLGSGTINNKKRKIENLITLMLKYPFIKGFIASIGMANGE